MQEVKKNFTNKLAKKKWKNLMTFEESLDKVRA